MSANNVKVWGIEDFDKKLIPESEHGKFFTGDSYIVMKEHENKNGESAYDLHMWIGDKSTQDEYGSCAFLTTQLDDEFGGVPVQYRETQGSESSKFLGYFKPAIQYKMGGVKSGFAHVTPNDFSDIKRLLWVRGRHQVRVDEVEMTWESLNNSDCFIIDMGDDIYVWSGEKSNHFERIQTMNVANSIKNNERGGKVTVTNLDGSTSKLHKLLGEPSCEIADAEPEKPRARVCVSAENKIQLYKISDESGDIETTLVADKLPFEQSMLESGDVYLVNNTAAEQIFVWKGRGASNKERKSAMATAVKFIEKFELSLSTNITVMADRAETVLFRTLFKTWVTREDQEGLGKMWSANKVAKIVKMDFDASKLLEQPSLAAKYQLPDDGTGDVKIYRVEGNGRAEVDPSSYGQFYGGDCYIIRYTYELRGRQHTILYYWIGAGATIDEVTALPILTVQLDAEEFDDRATQIRVTQGHEPLHLLLLFGTLVINKGGTSREGGQTETDEKRLFHVHAGASGKSRAVEVSAESSKLNSNDSFVLVTPTSSYLWIGKGATEGEVSSAVAVADLLNASELQHVLEGEETDEFWDELGGKSSYFSSPTLQDKDMPLRLFECYDSTGNFTVEEVVGDWDQSDLNSDNVMLLDSWSSLYVWIGKNANENEQTEAMKTASQYLNLDATARSADTTSIVRITEGYEPISFSGFFQNWKHEL